MELRDEDVKAVAEEYVTRGMAEGVASVLPELEHRVRAMAESLIAFRSETLPRWIEQTDQKMQFLKKRWEVLMEDMNQTRQAWTEGWSPYNYWLAFAFWWLVVLGEAIAFPYLYRDVFDLPLLAGAGFAALIPAASIFVKGIFYNTLSEVGRSRFRMGLFGFWLLSVLLFISAFLIARGLTQHNQSQQVALSLVMTSADDPLLVWRIISLTALWLFGLTTAIGLAIKKAHYRNVAHRIVLMEKERQETEQQLEKATTTHSDLLRQLKEGETLVEKAILTAQNHLHTMIQKKKEDAAVLQHQYPHLFPKMPPQNGVARSVQQAGRMLVLLAGLLIGASEVSAQPQIFVIQDMTRSPEKAAQDFQGFGRLAMALPEGGALTLFGSDGIQYASGRIDGEYRGKIQRQQQALMGQGRALYLHIQQTPGDMRDYATALAEILPRIRENALVVVLGKPLYRVNPIDWDGRTPGLSWAFSAYSPMGETALHPAPARFRVAMVFDPNDFASPNHRADMQRFWKILLARLNGELALFTTDAQALPGLLTASQSTDGDLRAILSDIPEADRTAPLELQEALRLGW